MNTLLTITLLVATLCLAANAQRRYYPGRGYLREERSGMSRYRSDYEDLDDRRPSRRIRPSRLRRNEDDYDDYYEYDAEPIRRPARRPRTRSNGRRYYSRYNEPASPNNGNGNQGGSSPVTGNVNFPSNIDLSKLGNGVSFASGTAFSGGAGGASAAIGQALSSGGFATGFGAAIRSGGQNGNGNEEKPVNGNGNYRARSDRDDFREREEYTSRSRLDRYRG